MLIWMWHWAGYGVAAIGLALLIRTLVGDRSRGRRRCGRCWYDLAHAGDVPLTCPECGRKIIRVRHLHRTRRRKVHALAALGLMLLGYASIATPRVQNTGWRGAVPTTVLVPLLPWLPQVWHDTDFYRTGVDDEQRAASQTFDQKFRNESSRILTGAPETLVEELACRWEDEPLIVQRLAIRIWDWSYGTPKKPWYWNHGVDAEHGSGVYSMAWGLRQKSLHAGALSSSQARETRELALRRYAHPSVRTILDDFSVPLEVGGAAHSCRSPDANAFEAALIDVDSGDVLSSITGPYPQVIGGPRGSRTLGPLPYGTESITLRYTLLDAEERIIDRHTVSYQVDFQLSIDEFAALPRPNRQIEWFVHFKVSEVNGEPVETPRLP